MDQYVLIKAIQKLDRLDAAGWMEDFLRDFYAATQTARRAGDTRNLTPNQQIAITRMAELGAKVFGVSQRRAEKAAHLALGAPSREAVAIRILNEHITQLNRHEAESLR